MTNGQTLTTALAEVLRVDCAQDKAIAVRQLVAQWQDGSFTTIGKTTPPARSVSYTHLTLPTKLAV